MGLSELLRQRRLRQLAEEGIRAGYVDRKDVEAARAAAEAAKAGGKRRR